MNSVARPCGDSAGCKAKREAPFELQRTGQERLSMRDSCNVSRSVETALLLRLLTSPGTTQVQNAALNHFKVPKKLKTGAGSSVSFLTYVQLISRGVVAQRSVRLY